MELKLPLNVVSRADLGRLARRLEFLDEQLIARRTQSAEVETQIAGIVDKLLEDIAALNGFNLMDESHRQRLKLDLEKIGPDLPELHISFAVEPTSRVVRRLLDWFRINIHPSALLNVGVEPAIAAGCVLRTPNRVFDFSLKSTIKQQDNFLLQLIKGTVRGK